MPRSRRRKGVPKPRPKANHEKSFNAGQKAYYDPGARPKPVNHAKHIRRAAADAARTHRRVLAP